MNQMSEDTRERIEQIIKEHRITLFMKGTPSFPQCGFSARAVNILKEEGVKFAGVDVLSDNDIREGIKVFSDWPTIPQLYVDGEFIGGSDIMLQMHEAGELSETLKNEG
jgi:monothiol glutaredoxin